MQPGHEKHVDSREILRPRLQTPLAREYRLKSKTPGGLTREKSEASYDEYTMYLKERSQLPLTQPKG